MLSSPKIHSSYTTEETKSCRSGMGVNVDRMFFFLTIPLRHVTRPTWLVYQQQKATLHKSAKDQHF